MINPQIILWLFHGGLIYNITHSFICLLHFHSCRDVSGRIIHSPQNTQTPHLQWQQDGIHRMVNISIMSKSMVVDRCLGSTIWCPKKTPKQTIHWSSQLKRFADLSNLGNHHLLIFNDLCQFVEAPILGTEAVRPWGTFQFLCHFQMEFDLNTIQWMTPFFSQNRTNILSRLSKNISSWENLLWYIIRIYIWHMYDLL